MILLVKTQQDKHLSLPKYFKGMRRFIAGALLLVYLFSTTEFHEFLKLPTLVEHFTEHKSKDNSISVWQFLCLHYANNKADNKDSDRDMKLPFKTIDGGNCNSFISILPEEKFALCMLPIATEIKSNPIFYKAFYNTSFWNAIWQPPQLS